MAERPGRNTAENVRPGILSTNYNLFLYLDLNIFIEPRNIDPESSVHSPDIFVI